MGLSKTSRVDGISDIADTLRPLATGSDTRISVELREYPVALGAIAATLTELYEPFGINDNLTIPVISALAMEFGFARIRMCQAPVASATLMGWLTGWVL